MDKMVVDDYGWDSIEGPHSCAYITPRILSLLKKLGVRRVLDLGSGNGMLCSQLADQGYEVVGVEVDEKGISIARSAYPEVDFYNFSVEDDPNDFLKDETPFEVIISTEVIEHLYSPHRLPIYARGMLQDQGYLIITTPYHGYLKNLVISLLNKWDFHFTVLRHGGHIKFFSRRTITRLLTDNGFKVVGFSGVGRIPYLWKSMVIIAQKI
ncbi:MAG: class I SAM-dependent methyltransferase [Anaerolineales bacterium]